ncbi:MAG: DUF6785 family protein, partial [bacterium]
VVAPEEAIACYLVLLLGSWAATWAFIEMQMPLLTSPAVFASPENGWKEHVLPNLPRWAVGPLDEPYASGFYNGLPDSVARPWRRWIVPAAAWSAFTIALALFSAALGSLLARQWVEHDRLTFPMAETVLSLVRGAMRDRRFWWGAAASASVPAWNLLQSYLPVFPKMSLYFGAGPEGLEWLKGAERFIPVLNVALLGLFYFVHRDILLSMIVCFFAFALEQHVLSLAGVKLEHNDVFGWGGSVGGWQTAGSVLALVAISLWSGRGALRTFVRAGLRGEDAVGGWMSPRATLLALVGASAALGAWMVALGLRSVGPLVSFLLSSGLGYIGFARLTAESGMELGWPIEPSSFALLAGGTAALAPAGFVALALSESWVTGSSMISLTSISLQGEKTRTAFRFPRAVLWTGLAAVALSTAISIFATAKLGYDRGANNFGNWSYQWAMRIPYDQAAECARTTKVGVDGPRLGWLTAGAALASGLVVMRNRVVGWFLHPVGLVLGALGKPGGSQGNVYIFTALIAWIIKSLVVKLGGVESYERLKPLFVGLVVGHYAPDLLQAVGDLVSFIQTGHPLQ